MALYLISAFSLLAGLITGRSLFFNLTYAFAGLVIVAWLWTWSSANWLRLGRYTRVRRAQVGRYLEERFSVRNASILPKLWLEVYDQSTLPGHRASHVVSNLGPAAHIVWMVRTLCTQRGEFHLGPLRIVTGDPFGLFEIERKISATSRLVVYPSTVPIANFILPTGFLPGGDALRRRTHYVTTNAAGIRDYAPGDSMSRIHWRSTARRARLVVKEFELDPLADIWIMLDADQTVQAGEFTPPETDATRMPWAVPEWTLPPLTDEYSVTIAASLAQHFLEQDRSVGLAANGLVQETIQVDRGSRQLTKILETLAVLKTGSVMPFEQLITVEGNHLTRGTTLILITPSMREGWATAASRLTQRGLRLIVVLIDPESFGGRSGADALAGRLVAHKIPVTVVHQGDDLSSALNRPRQAGL